MWAATKGHSGQERIDHTATIVALLAAGANPDLQLPDGHTALMLAARNGHATAVHALIQGGASVDLVNKAGYTALMLAADVGDHAKAVTVSALLHGGADPTIREPDGFWYAGGTAATIAARAGHTKAAWALEEAEAQWVANGGKRTEL